MDREARTNLDTTVAALREIARKVESIAPHAADAETRRDLRQIQEQSKAAIEYYGRLVERPRGRANVPRIAQTVAQAAFGCSGIGLVPPSFVLPDSISKPRR